ncbi:MAG: hypothetical protein HKO77_10395 [Gemmatimonadetes bacterium]|nr:hypothetical protein [Gemmatimonadota bacterium]
MYPILFRIPETVPLIGGFALHSFGVMVGLAFLLGTYVLQRRLVPQGYAQNKVVDVALSAAIAGFIGAKLFWLFSRPDRLATDPLGALLSGTGFTWYGGLLLGLLVFWLSLRRAKIPAGKALDGLALALPLSIAVGRVGCFLAGDDYGRPTDSPLGVAFPEGFPPTTVDRLQDSFGLTVDPVLIEQFGQVIPVHPTQLYESAISLAVFGVLATRKGPKTDGWLFALWLCLYGVQRFSVEVLRVNPRVFLGLTVAQLISLAAVAIGAFYLVKLGQNQPNRTAGAS